MSRSQRLHRRQYEEPAPTRAWVGTALLAVIAYIVVCELVPL